MHAGRRPPRSLPAVRQLVTESAIRSRLISSHISAKTAMTVTTIDPIGVCVSTSPPARFNIHSPASTPQRYGEGQHVLREPPSRSSVVTTNLSPSPKTVLTMSKADR